MRGGRPVARVMCLHVQMGLCTMCVESRAACLKHPHAISSASVLLAGSTPGGSLPGLGNFGMHILHFAHLTRQSGPALFRP